MYQNSRKYIHFYHNTQYTFTNIYLPAVIFIYNRFILLDKYYNYI